MLPMLALLLLSVPLLAPSTLSVDPKASSIRFRVDHSLHVVEGESKEIDGKALAKDDGKVIALVRASLRSEEHTSELQSQSNLVCRLLLEKKKIHVRT